MAYYVDRNVKLTWWERTYIPEILRGMMITSRHFFRNIFGFIPFFLGKKKDREIFTVYYPEETVQFPIAYRGRPVLALNEDHLPNCVACGLCEIACPAYCIDIIPGENSGKQNKVERYPVAFTIDYAVCIFCGNVQMGDCANVLVAEGKHPNALLMRQLTKFSSHLLFTAEDVRGE